MISVVEDMLENISSKVVCYSYYQLQSNERGRVLNHDLPGKYRDFHMRNICKSLWFYRILRRFMDHFSRESHIIFPTVFTDGICMVRYSSSHLIYSYYYK